MIETGADKGNREEKPPVMVDQDTEKDSWSILLRDLLMEQSEQM